MKDGVVLRLSHESKAEVTIAVSSFATWITGKNLTSSQSEKFVRITREIIERSRIIDVKQVGNERIARFSFKDKQGKLYNLYAEFFSGGNQIVTESIGSEEFILEVARPQRFRHRSLVRGEKYSLPPARGVFLANVSESSLDKIYRDSIGSVPQNLPAIQWFGRQIGTSRKFVEEIFARSRLDPSTPLELLSEQDIRNLSESTKGLVLEIEKSENGYLLIPFEGETESPEDKQGGDRETSPSLDVCPIVPSSWKGLEKSGIAKIQTFESFGAALDEAQGLGVVSETKRQAATETRNKMLELDSAIRKQNDLIEKNQTNSLELKLIAQKLMQTKDQGISDNVIQSLVSLDLLKKIPERRNELQFTSEPRVLLSNFASKSLASRLFDEAKRFQESNQKLVQIRDSLKKKRDDYLIQTVSTEERAVRRSILERRQREWFERYRWFITSDGRLVVGGRDSTSNSVVINKHAQPQDIVFHADLHGSPFFILKNGTKIASRGSSVSIENEVALEVAQATVSFSRAWKDQLGSADAYWILPDQLKKSAPSGLYLPRGSFFIEGKKNFLKHIKTELAIGILLSSKLSDIIDFQRTDKSATDQLNVKENPVSEHFAAVCGPEKSLVANCEAVVRISYGKEKGSAIAKKVKQQLINKLRDPVLKELAKKISLEEIIRVLPSGSFKMVSEKQDY